MWSSSTVETCYLGVRKYGCADLSVRRLKQPVVVPAPVTATSLVYMSCKQSRRTLYWSGFYNTNPVVLVVWFMYDDSTIERETYVVGQNVHCCD